MQPLISPVDHESRSNSRQVDEENIQRETENSPLLHRFPQNVHHERSTISLLILGLLFFILIVGAIISIYLLVIQDNSENVLPPVLVPLQIVTRMEWDKSFSPSNLSLSSFKAKYITIVQTDTRQCHGLQTCIVLLNEMQKLNEDESLPYNFLISSDGLLFEARGWLNSSQNPALVLAFIGNFTEVAPTVAQVEEAKNLISQSESLGHLEPYCRIVINNSTECPRYLKESLQRIPQLRMAKQFEANEKPN